MSKKSSGHYTQSKKRHSGLLAARALVEGHTSDSAKNTGIQVQKHPREITPLF